MACKATGNFCCQQAFSKIELSQEQGKGGSSRSSGSSVPEILLQAFRGKVLDFLGTLSLVQDEHMDRLDSFSVCLFSDAGLTRNVDFDSAEHHEVTIP